MAQIVTRQVLFIYTYIHTYLMTHLLNGINFLWPDIFNRVRMCVCLFLYLRHPDIPFT